MIRNLLGRVYPFYPVLFILGSGIITLFFGLSEKKPYKLLAVALSAFSLAGSLFINIFSFNLKGEFNSSLFNFGTLQVLLNSIVLFSAINILLFLALFNFAKKNFIKIIIMFDICITSFIFFIVSINFIMIFVSLVFFAAGAFQIVTSLSRGNLSKSIPEYSVKNNIIRFFLLSAFSLLLMFFGFSLLFGATDLKSFSTVIESDFKNTSLLKTGFFLILCSAFTFGGFVPLHSPYMKMQRRIENTGTIIIWLLYLPAGLFIFLKLKDVLFNFLGGHNNYIIAVLLAVSAASILAGNIGAIRTTSIRRIFSFLMLGIMGLSIAGFVQYGLGLFDEKSVMIYLVSNVILAGAAYIPLMSVFYYLENINGSDHIGNIKGFGRQNIYLAINMSIIMLALGGLPGTYGYLARISLLSPYIKNPGSIFAEAGGTFSKILNISVIVVMLIAWAFIAVNMIRLILVIYSRSEKKTGAGQAGFEEGLPGVGRALTAGPQKKAILPVFIYIYVTFFTLLIILAGIAGLFELFGLKQLLTGISIMSLNL